MRSRCRGAPTAIDPVAGDIAYYAPWGNLALFYRDFRRSPGLVRLGRIDLPGDVTRLQVLEGVTIVRADAAAVRPPTRDWSADELHRIAAADDLHISPFREDGRTYGTPTWIWSVVVDGALFVRAYNGTASRWYGAAVRERAGRITVAGLTLEVAFATADPALNERIDAAYRAKYAGSRYLAPMVGDRARAATVLIRPRAGGA